MHFLLSNDDGYQSLGIHALAEALSYLGKVTVVAPDRDRSGASNSLTLDAPLYVKQDSHGYYYVNGTPTDCVHLAITGLMEEEPDMVISGINTGANLGDDVCIQARLRQRWKDVFRSTCDCISQTGEDWENYSESVDIATSIIKHVMEYPLQQDTLLNVNCLKPIN